MFRFSKFHIEEVDSRLAISAVVVLLLSLYIIIGLAFDRSLLASHITISSRVLQSLHTTSTDTSR